VIAAWLTGLLCCGATMTGCEDEPPTEPGEGLPTLTAPFLLDRHPGAVAAYSLRRLREGYEGPAIRVRRSADDTEQDIGFGENGWVDLEALGTFVGRGAQDMGYVTTWYDQTGGEPLRSPEPGRQPRIVESGAVVVTDGGRPAIAFHDAEDRPQEASTCLTSAEREVPVSSVDLRLALVTRRTGGRGERAYAGVDPRGRPHEGAWYRGHQTYLNGGSARAPLQGQGLVEGILRSVVLRNRGDVAELWQGNSRLTTVTSADDADLMREASYLRVSVGGNESTTQGITGLLPELLVYDSYGEESWPLDYHRDAAAVWGAGPAAWNADALLPQRFEYQVTLYDWLATLTVDDVTLPRPEITWDGSYADVDALADLWVLATAVTTSRVVRGEPQWYVLDAGNGQGIEATGAVRLWHEPGDGYRGNPPRSWANEPAELYRLSVANADGEGNPYHGLRALGLRALVVAAVDLMMYHETLLRENSAGWQDIYGKAFLSWAEAYRFCGGELPPEVARAFEEGMTHFLRRMIDVGPRAVNTNMDMFSLHGAAELYMATEDPAVQRLALQAVKRALFGYPDGALETRHDVFKTGGYDHGVFDPSGFIMEGDQPDVFYGGESIYHLTGALAAVTDRDTGQVPEPWAFLKEVVRRLGVWRVYQYFYEPGTASAGMGGAREAHHYHAGAGLSGRTGAGVPAGQAGVVYKHLTLADHFADLRHLVYGQSHRSRLPGVETMEADIAESLAARSAELQEIHVDTPPEWRWWSPWCKATAYLPPRGWYSRLAALVDAADPSSLPPVARPEHTYSVALGGPPVGDEYWSHKGHDGDRAWGFFLEAQARQGGYGGWYGGKLETFWTETTGVVLLNRHGKTGCDGDTEDSQCWDNLEHRAAHHVWGRDEHGHGFSTLHLRGRDLERPVTFALAETPPRVTVENRFNNPSHADDPTTGLSGEQTGAELEGELSVVNTFEALDDGVRITHALTADGTDLVTELWASVPVFLRLYSPLTPGDQPQADLADTTIEYWDGAAWQPLPEDTSGDGVPELVETERLRLGRDFLLGDGPQYVYLVFDAPQRTRLSTRIYYDPYQTKTGVRTVHIDLHGDPGQPAPLPSTTVSYALRTGL
jgi:hypothetical protein